MAVLVFILFLGGGLTAGLLRAWLQVRRLRARTLVRTLASITAQNLPLARSLRAAGSAERGKLRRMYEHLAIRLECGDPLSAALRAAVRACPGQIVGAVQAAERTGTLAAALSTAATERPPVRALLGRLPLWYPLVLLLVAPGILLIMRIFIAPKFKEIFLDYDVALPPATAWVLGADGGFWILVLLVALLVFVLAVAQAFILRNFVPRLGDRVQVPYRIWDALVWHCPVTRPVVQTRALTRQLPAMQAAVRAGRDLSVAARAAAAIPVNWYARCRLTRWAAALENGVDPLDAARRAGLPPPLLRVLGTARGDLPTRLAYLASYYESLAFHWESVLTAILAPVVVLTWGLVTGFIVYSLFVPLIAITNSVMDTLP